ATARRSRRAGAASRSCAASRTARGASSSTCLPGLVSFAPPLYVRRGTLPAYCSPPAAQLGAAVVGHEQNRNSRYADSDAARVLHPRTVGRLQRRAADRETAADAGQGSRPPGTRG